MKKNVKILSLLLAAALFSAILSGCDGLVAAKYDSSSEAFVIDGEKYVECSGSVCSAYIGEKYSKWSDMIFYLIPGYDSREFLTLSREDGASVFKKEGLEEPELSKLSVTKIYVCRVTEAKVIAESEITDEELISRITDAVINGEECVMPGSSEFTRELRIASVDFPYLYYRVSYMEDTRADGYLYDRSLGKCVFVGKMLTGYVA